jgi:hypothetical protein
MGARDVEAAMNDYPPGYRKQCLPDHENYRHWYGAVSDYATIRDPMFHQGCKVAIRLYTGETTQTQHPRFRWLQTTRLVGEWMEFKTFKQADAYVRWMVRLSK